jgi:DNA-directed RNA polymerase subunit RPC12/RpoP
MSVWQYPWSRHGYELEDAREERKSKLQSQIDNINSEMDTELLLKWLDKFWGGNLYGLWPQLDGRSFEGRRSDPFWKREHGFACVHCGEDFPNLRDQFLVLGFGHLSLSQALRAFKRLPFGNTDDGVQLRREPTAGYMKICRGCLKDWHDLSDSEPQVGYVCRRCGHWILPLTSDEAAGDKLVMHHLSYEKNRAVPMHRSCHTIMHKAVGKSILKPMDDRPKQHKLTESEKQEWHAQVLLNAQKRIKAAEERRSLRQQTTAWKKEQELELSEAKMENLVANGWRRPYGRFQRFQEQETTALSVPVRCSKCGHDFEGKFRTTCPRCRTFFQRLLGEKV